MSLAFGISVGAARRHLAQAFRAAGLDTPDLDARVLVGHALGLDASGVATASDRRLTAGEARQLEASLARRLAREPVARIVGRKEFWGRDFLIGPATLVPRPETELVVETALGLGDAFEQRRRPLRVADLGTGSGAILISLLAEWPEAIGVGTDIDPRALDIARNNARRLGVDDRAGFVAGDFGSALGGGFDLVVSNPPYVRTSDIEALAPEVRDYDPRRALDAQADGLAAYRALARDIVRLLAPRGIVVVEVGQGQASFVSSLFRAVGLAMWGDPRRDLAGIERVLCARCLAVSGPQAMLKKDLEYAAGPITFRSRNRP